MKMRSTSLFRFLFYFIDPLILNIVYITMYSTYDHILGFEKEYMFLFITINIFWLLCSYINGGYLIAQSPISKGYDTETISIYLLFSSVIIVSTYILHLSHFHNFIFTYLAVFCISLIIIRLIFYSVNAFIVRSQYINTNLIIIGYNEISTKLVKCIQSQNSNITILGYFNDIKAEVDDSHLNYLGSIDDCIAYSSQHNVTEIYSTLSPEKYHYIYNLVQEAESKMIRFKFIPDLKMFVDRNIHIDFIQDIPIISLRAEPLQYLPSILKKRAFDIIFSLLVIIFLLSWLFPILGIIILIDSKGPVFFRQKRSGKNNKPFTCFKFRSLKVNDQQDSIQVSRNDQRFTQVGKFLRKTNIDELPQFINVLTGHMSVVGPRPHMLKHTEQFSSHKKDYMIRHFVNPGITGWAQVNGFRGEITKDEHLNKRLEYDIWYMENWSLLLDVKIIYLTIRNVFMGEKNAF